MTDNIYLYILLILDACNGFYYDLNYLAAELDTIHDMLKSSKEVLEKMIPRDEDVMSDCIHAVQDPSKKTIEDHAKVGKCQILLLVNARHT